MNSYFQQFYFLFPTREFPLSEGSGLNIMLTISRQPQHQLKHSLFCSSH